MNQGHTYQEQIGAGGAGRGVLAHLGARFGRAGPAAWLERIALGQVKLDGVPAEAGTVLRAGQWLSWERPPWAEPPVPLDAAVLHQDPLLLAVAKPRGLPTMPAGGLYLEHTLLAVVRRRAPGASPMHRLGRDTSGLVLFARTAAAASAVQAAFRARRVGKVYRALCAGHPAHDVFTVDAPIGEVAHPLLGTGPHAARSACWSGGGTGRGDRARWWRWRSRPAARTRSGSTWPTPGTRWSATRSTALGARRSPAPWPCRAIPATCSTPGGSSSTIRPTAAAW
jgi:hypothetical protein